MTLDVRRLRAEFRKGRGEHKVVIVNAGIPIETRFIYPDGDRQITWPVSVQVCESPSGRSVQVHVNNKQVFP